MPNFYKPLFEMIGWKEVDKNGFVNGNIKIYLKKWDYSVGNSLGVRHLCFWAEDREMVDKVSKYIKSAGVRIIRGPLIVSEYSPDYYTIDFYDLDGFMLEVAHTPDKLN